MLIVGTEWLIDAAGCRAEALRDAETLRAVFARVVAETGLHVVGDERWHTFPGAGGVTGLALLSESHLACHTYPEFGVATFNLYCCRARPAWPWEERLREMLGATRVNVRVVERASAEAGAEAEATGEAPRATDGELSQAADGSARPASARVAPDSRGGGGRV